MNKVKKVYHNIMRQLYKEAAPPLDWDKLYNSSPQERDSFKFQNHYIPADRMSEIIDLHLKKSKLPKHVKNGIEFNVILGCAPTTKKPK